jgi:uncharacterized membrane protein YoaK (UPF0700 family)
MTRHGRTVQALAICLAALAGYVDAVAFLETGGFFVSFMSGNTTRLGVAIAQNAGTAVVAAGFIAIFVAGVAGGSLIGHFAGHQRRSVVLGLVAALLVIAGCCTWAQAPVAALVLMTISMGAENTVFEQDGEIQIGLTYMTGTLVKLGQRFAAMLRGGDRTGWISYFLLWIGLLCGGVTGATVYGRLGIAAIWPGAAGAAMLCLLSALSGKPKMRQAR